MPRVPTNRNLKTYVVKISALPPPEALPSDASPSVRAVYAHLHGPIRIVGSKPRGAEVVGIKPADRTPERVAACIVAYLSAAYGQGPSAHPNPPKLPAVVSPGGLGPRTVGGDLHIQVPKCEGLKGVGAIWSGKAAFIAHNLAAELWLQEGAQGDLLAFAISVDFDLEQAVCALPVVEAVAHEKPAVAPAKDVPKPSNGVEDEAEFKGPSQGPAGRKHTIGPAAQKRVPGYMGIVSEPVVVDTPPAPAPNLPAIAEPPAEDWAASKPERPLW